MADAGEAASVADAEEAAVEIAEGVAAASRVLCGDGDPHAAWWLLFALREASTKAKLLAACARRDWEPSAVAAAVELLTAIDGWTWETVDRALEAGVNRDATGAFFTPAALAERLAASLLAHRVRPKRVVDPACGSGGLLDAVLRSLLDSGVPPNEAVQSLWGYDINPEAAKVARWRLQCRAGTLLTATAEDGPHIACRDTLRDDVPRDFDAVIANPPFGNAIEKKTGRTDDERRVWAERYPEAATGAYDKASLFVAWALRHTVAGAPVAMLVPRALLSAPYALSLRQHCEVHRPLSAWLPVERGDWFNAASVHVVGLVWSGTARAQRLRVSRSGAPDDHIDWSGAAADSWCVHTSPWRAWARLPRDWKPLGDVADVSASAAVGEAYDWRADITEAEESDGHCFRLVTSGAIDPLEILWGKTQRYLKQRYERPVVSVRALSERRRRQAGTPKVLVPGLSAALEAAADADGRHIGAVATLCVMQRAAAVVKQFDDPVFARGQGLLFASESAGDSPRSVPSKGSLGAGSASASDSANALQSLTLYLNSASARGWYLAHYGAQALAGGSVQLTAAKLRSVPVPPWVLSPVDATHADSAQASDAVAKLLQAAELRSHELPRKRPPPADWQAPTERVACVKAAGVPEVWAALLAQTASVDAMLWAASVVVAASAVEERGAGRRGAG